MSELKKVTEPESINLRKLAFILAERMNLPQVTAHKVINSFIDILIDQLKNQNQISINNFGTFRTKKLKKKSSYDPEEKKFIEVPEKLTVSFSSRIKF